MPSRLSLHRLFARWTTQNRSESATEALRQQQLAANALGQAEKGLQHFLGLSASAAYELASKAQTHYQQLVTHHRAAQTSHQQGHDVAQEIIHALQQDSCLLALPLQIQSLQIVRQLVAQLVRPAASSSPSSTAQSLPQIVLVETPLLRDMMREILPQWQRENPGWQLKPAKDVIKLLKEQKARTQQQTSHPYSHTLYLSFPESHPFQASTSITLEMQGKPYSFSLLEALLCCSGLPNLLSLQAQSAGAEHASSLRLVRLPMAEAAPQTGSAALQTTAHWLAAQLQSCALALPEQALCWQALFRASSHFRAIERSDKLRQLEAYFDTWQSHGSGLDLATHQMLKSRLQQLRSTK